MFTKDTLFWFTTVLVLGFTFILMQGLMQGLMDFYLGHPMYVESKNKIYKKDCAVLKVVQSMVCFSDLEFSWIGHKIKEIVCFVPDCYNVSVNRTL